MKQRTLAMMTGFEQYTRKTRRAIFLEEMEQVVPWGELCALVAPHYPQPGKGRRPVGVERMLRIYFLQQWFNLSDPAVEEALYDSGGMRQFVGIDLGCEPVPDETTVCKFRHLLEEHQLGEQILGQVNLHLQAQGVRITTGTIVDATILHAPTSTKNREQQRDPEMHQTKKGKQWYFGMKAHVGVDSKTTVRSKVEHVFAVMKLKFGFVKLRFRGLKKNATQLFAVCALVNLYLARKKLLLLAPASPGAKVADHGRAAQAGGRPEKTVSQCREQGETGVLWCDFRDQKRNSG